MHIGRSLLFLVMASVLFGQQVLTLDDIAPKESHDSLTFRTPVPEFEAQDLLGRTWSTKDLRGSITLVRIWSTSCGPCRKEHPILQGFADEARRLRNVQVLTFALDNDAERVRRYMAESGYTFPVIVNGDLETRLFPVEGGIPKSWVIGPDGRRADAFRSWTFGRVLMEVEKLAKEK